MVIDATKINYFENPPRSTYDTIKKVNKKSKKEETGVIIDASTNKKLKGKFYEQK